MQATSAGTHYWLYSSSGRADGQVGACLVEGDWEHQHLVAQRVLHLGRPQPPCTLHSLSTCICSSSSSSGLTSLSLQARQEDAERKIDREALPAQDVKLQGVLTTICASAKGGLELQAQCSEAQIHSAKYTSRPCITARAGLQKRECTLSGAASERTSWAWMASRLCWPGSAH